MTDCGVMEGRVGQARAIAEEDVGRVYLRRLGLVDKSKENHKIVVNKQQPMEQLIFALEHALSMAKQPSTKANEVISYIHKRLEDIEQPHRALEEELDLLVQTKTPPGGEFYRARADRKELAVAFFHRVYGRFYEAGLLYRHQLRGLDFPLYDALARAKDAPAIPTKSDAIDKLLGTTKRPKSLLRQHERLVAATKRRLAV